MIRTCSHDDIATIEAIINEAATETYIGPLFQPRNLLHYFLGRFMQEDTSTISWNQVANDWVAHADANDYRNHFLMPITFGMLGDVTGLRVLDLGCGEGGYTRELARRGARVSGVDSSPKLVEIACQRASWESLNIDFRQVNASKLDCFSDDLFDVVLAAMSLMDVEDYVGAVREIHRVLLPGAELLMSITHPCFSAPLSEWQREAGHDLSYFKVDRYLERISWEDMITPKFSRTVTRRHRPLEDYISAALKAGLRLVDFREPGASAEQIRKSGRLAQLNRIPYFLFLRWKK